MTEKNGPAAADPSACNHGGRNCCNQSHQVITGPPCSAYPYPAQVNFAAGGPSVMVPPQHDQQLFLPAQLPRKSCLVAYICWLFLGLFGAHHFYLRRYFFGIMYCSTFGLFGCGWIIDLFRLPWMVSKVNREQEEAALLHGSSMTASQMANFYSIYRDRSVVDAYVLWFPLGLFGLHQFYLGRFGFGVTYSVSVGLGGIGWLTDVFRIPSLVREANEKMRRVRNGEAVERTLECSVADAYQMAFPFGFLGLHHFYMGRVGQGMAYLFTLGLFGIGWLVDLVRMPYLVHRHNKEVQERHTWLRHLDDAYIYAFPFGIVGFHRFYLNGPKMGLLYFCTAGLFLIGWLVDLVRMPCLVAAANEREADRQRLIGNNQVYVFQPAVGSTHSGQMPSQYGAVHQPCTARPLYPTRQTIVTYVSYNNLPSNLHGQSSDVPAPTNALPNTYTHQPPIPPPPYGSGEGPHMSPLPPPYQETMDCSGQESNPSGPDPDQKQPPVDETST